MEYMTMKEELIAEMKYAIKNELALFAVRIYFEDTNCFETIINTNENFHYKMKYYDKTYNDDLEHNHAKGIKIVDFTSAECYSDIETAFDF